MSKLDIPQTDEQLHTTSLGERLQLIIESLPPEGVTLKEIQEIIGSDSLFMVTIFLSLVFLIPVSIPGVSTVFGSAILLIGITQLFRRQLWLPRKIAERSIPTEKLVGGLQKALGWFHRLEKVSRPHRLSKLATGYTVETINLLSFILAALLLMMPFGLIPFSNTIPAVALIFFSLGMLQKDGGSILLGHLANVATLIYFSVLIATGGYAIMEIFERLNG